MTSSPIDLRKGTNRSRSGQIEGAVLNVEDDSPVVDLTGDLGGGGAWAGEPDRPPSVGGWECTRRFNSPSEGDRMGNRLRRDSPSGSQLRGFELPHGRHPDPLLPPWTGRGPNYPWSIPMVRRWTGARPS